MLFLGIIYGCFFTKNGFNHGEANGFRDCLVPTFGFRPRCGVIKEVFSGGRYRFEALTVSRDCVWFDVFFYFFIYWLS